MIDAKLICTLFIVDQHLSGEEKLFSDSTLFCFFTGVLQYLIITGPHMSFRVNSICQFMYASIEEDHFLALKQIMRYVKGTTRHELT